MVVRFGSYNVCFPLWQRDSSRAIAVIDAHFDVVLLQEVSRGFLDTAVAALGSDWSFVWDDHRDAYNTTAVLHRISVTGPGTALRHDKPHKRWGAYRCLRGKTVAHFPAIATMAVSAWLGHGCPAWQARKLLTTTVDEVSPLHRVVVGADTNVWSGTLSGELSVRVGSAAWTLSLPEVSAPTAHRSKYFWDSPAEEAKSVAEVQDELTHAGDYLVESGGAVAAPVATEATVRASDHLPLLLEVPDCV